ncbi:MAG: hypothetical protein ACKO96_43325, partial [Flammeovirgaceae bacterium]
MSFLQLRLTGRGLYAVALPVEVKVKKFRYTICINVRSIQSSSLQLPNLLPKIYFQPAGQQSILAIGGVYCMVRTLVSEQ